MGLIVSFKTILNPYLIVVLAGANGFCVFPFTGIIFEELISRLNPRYLLTVSVIMAMGQQSVAVVSSLSMGALFNVPNEEKSV